MTTKTSWDVKVTRDYRPLYALGKDKRLVEDRSSAFLSIGVQFDSGVKAAEFQTKALALLER